MARGCTNETASIRLTPVRDSASISATLASVGTGASFCSPSRGPTSRSEIAPGRSLIGVPSLARPLSLPRPPWRPLVVEGGNAFLAVAAERRRPPGGVLDVHRGGQVHRCPPAQRLLGCPDADRRVRRDRRRQLQRGVPGLAGRHPAVNQAEPVRLVDADLAVSYTHLRAHETRHDLVCRLLLEKKK